MKSEIYLCPYCGYPVEVTDGNCWYCPNCGIHECSLTDDMVFRGGKIRIGREV